MKRICCVILCLVSFKLYAQKDTVFQQYHSFGIKYNISSGNLFGGIYFAEKYQKTALYFLVPAEFLYSYKINPIYAFSIGLMAGSYSEKEYSTFKSYKISDTYMWHTMEYVGVKPSVWVQTSAKPGISNFRAGFGVFLAKEAMHLSITDPYGLSDYYEKVNKNVLYAHIEMGGIHKIPLAKGSGWKLLLDYGVQVQPYFRLSKNSFQERYFQNKATPIPGMGFPLPDFPISLYQGIGISYDFSR